METASFSLSIIMVGWLGTIALASHQVMTTISQFTFMVYYGLGAAVAVRTSYFHGQRDVQNVRHTVTAGLHLMVMLEVVLGGTIFLLRNHIYRYEINAVSSSPTVIQPYTCAIYVCRPERACTIESDRGNRSMTIS